MVDFKALVPWRSKSQPPAPREDFFDPLVTFRREMDRMFDEFFGGGTLRSMQSGQAFTPAVDIDENDKEMVVSAELPGVSEKDVEVKLAGDMLTIKGAKKAEHEEKDGDSYYMERRFGSFVRAVRLPFEVKDEDVEAKPAEMQKAVRRIEVRAH